MRKYLLPETGTFYKVNMHSHSTLSDGAFSPEDLKKYYMEQGYSAIAYTEHGKIHDLTHLSDENFVAITSYELDMTNKNSLPNKLYTGDPKSWRHLEVIHMNLYARDPHNVTTVDVSDLKTNYCVENINEAIRRANEAGFLVSYNHPNWSLNTYNLYANLEGLFGLEIANGASDRSSDLEYTPYVYDQMSRAGQKLVCVAGDDNHGKQHFFLAWTMVKADSLSHESLIDALEKGNCYASMGPTIEELYYEDGKVHIRCSEANRIFLSTIGRRKDCAYAKADGTPLTEAAFSILDEDVFFRITVRDKEGKHANTRIYYVDELK